MNNDNIGIIRENSFRKIYTLFICLFTIICILFIGFVLFMDILSTKSAIICEIVFATFMLLLGIGFVLTLKNEISIIFELLDDMISGAINEERVIGKYDETLLSSLESKIFRYIKITKSNKEAVEKEKDKVNSLVTDISHQTKTPIANILMYSQLALENQNIDDYSKEIVTDIKAQSERLNFLIQSLIKMSRLENGIIKPNKCKVNISYVISKSIQKIFVNAERKKIEIKVNCSKDANANVDARWTSEAMVNILENAVKYTEVGGSIKILVTSHELFQRIDINDNGIGIYEEELNEIFKRFYRCKNANKFEGIGVGLFLAREIISLQGGYIKVSSQIGMGSTFSIFLPS